MNYTKTFAVFMITVSCLTAKAEVLYGTNSSTYNGPFGFEIVNNGTSQWAIAYEGIGVANKESGGEDTIFKVFCSDRSTMTSLGFSDSGTGQVYNPVSLSSSTFHSAEQKQQLQSLFDHVYSLAFDRNYSVIEPAYAAMFQLAVWEIMNDTSDVLSLRNGDLYIKSGTFWNTNADRTYWGNQMSAAQGEQLLALTDSWFDAIINDSWDAIGYSENKVNLTVWIAEGGSNVSQTFIGAAPTPEPATMMIFCLGAAGFAAVKLRKQIKKQVRLY